MFFLTYTFLSENIHFKCLSFQKCNKKIFPSIYVSVTNFSQYLINYSDAIFCIRLNIATSRLHQNFK
ncbi:hypothetical protein O3M35_008561 [Rhynocoris fuscipes]|uniref:Uncharacterized protein n=1 Tax=Rhynocoris fuscipes TaxID=488301 RepID=A0AAW1D9F2_9HEMI